MRFFGTLFFLVFSLSEIFAQRHCASTSYQENDRPLPTQVQIDHQLRAIKKRKATVGSDTMVYVIPVVVHVIHNNKSKLIGGYNNRNISDEQIHSQIAVLNNDYRKISGTLGFNTNPVGADTRIEFCLAQYDPEGKSTSGIIRVYNEKASFDYNANDVELKKISYWPSDQYLNIWVTNIGDPIIGYAQFPGGYGLPGATFDNGSEFTDGVAIDYKAFGTMGTATKPYHLGRTATHEIGHWLGLIHIWGDATCGNDYIDDTPEQENKDDDTLCNERYTYCTGMKVPRMFQNYLDYTGDKCMNIFTYGQKERMRSFFDINDRRKQLLLSGGCCNLPLHPFAQAIDFESSSLLPEDWSVINPDNANTWTLNSPGAYEKSNSCISILNKNNYSSDQSSYDVIASPSLDFSTNDHPNLYFDLAAAANSSSRTDSIVVEISFGCQEKKYQVKTIYGNDLNTARKNMLSFFPEAGDWSSVNIPLDAAAGQKRVRIYITSFGTAGTNVYLDNIKVYKASPTLIINPYPNPANESLSVDVLMEGESDVHFDLYNTIGKKIFSGSGYEKTSFTRALNTSDLQSGIYILTVSTGNQIASKKIIITR